MQHSCRLDGTPATEEDFAQARRWSARQATGRSSRYKTQEFVESDSDDNTTQTSGASTPSRCGSPSPVRGCRSKKTRSESSASPSPRRDTSPRHGGSQRPTASTSATSRPTTLPRSAPPAQKQAHKVRFEQGERSTGSRTAAKPREEKSAKSSAMTTAKDAPVKATKDQKAPAEEQPTTKKAETEIVQTPSATTSHLTSPKLDALAAVAKQAVQNLKKSTTGIKIAKPPAKPKKATKPPVKRHQHPIPAKGRSAYTGKGKATASVKKPPEVVKVSLQDVLGSLFLPPKQTAPTSPRPTAAIVPKPIAVTTEVTTSETIQIDDESDKDGKAPELPPTTDVEQDLELSQDSEEEIHGVCIVDVEDEQPIYSDMEPDYTAEELAVRQQQAATSTTSTTTMIPEILIEFQEEWLSLMTRLNKHLRQLRLRRERL